jgi:hypothetical protein
MCMKLANLAENQRAYYFLNNERNGFMHYNVCVLCFRSAEALHPYSFKVYRGLCLCADCFYKVRGKSIVEKHHINENTVIKIPASRHLEITRRENPRWRERKGRLR